MLGELGQAPEQEGPGFTVWYMPTIRDGFSLAFASHDRAAAQASFDGFRAGDWGVVRLFDPQGRELGVHVGRAQP